MHEKVFWNMIKGETYKFSCLTRFKCKYRGFIMEFSVEKNVKESQKVNFKINYSFLFRN
jgi:hypothetical protein